MGWVSDFNTADASDVRHMAFFQGALYAFQNREGVWRRDGPGAWTNVQTETGAGSGEGCYWPDDGALYCGTEFAEIRRSTDGAAWAVDVDLNALLGITGRVYAIGGWGSYLYALAYNAAGAGHCYLLRRDLAGVWTLVHDEPGNGANTGGCIGFGGTGFYYPYWSYGPFSGFQLHRWTGTAWEADPQFTYEPDRAAFTVFNDRLYMPGCLMRDPTNCARSGYWRRGLTSLSWTFLPLPGADDDTWLSRPAHRGGDGRLYGLATSGVISVVYRLNAAETAFEAVASAPLHCDGIGVLADGTIYLSSDDSGTTRFYVFSPVYNQTPIGNGLPPQALDVDSDGNALYIGIYNAAGQPVLVKVALPLTPTSIGSAVFDPTDGDSINVKCSEIGQQLAISGNFAAAGNEQVEVSQDAGLTWSPVDPNWGNERAQPLEVGPEGLNDLMVCLDNLQDLYDTEDMGVAWTQEQAAIGYSPGAMRRKRDEVILGDDAANSIEYSPNKGQQLTDVTGAFAGNVAALDVA